MQKLIKDLNAVYREHPALYKLDSDPAGFSWIDADDRGGNVFSFLRYDGEGQMIACLTNFSSEPRSDYRIGLPREGVWKELLNTDAEYYDGTGQIGNLGQVVAQAVPSHGYGASASVTLPPLGAVWLLFEPVATEETEEPEKVEAGVRAAAKQASRARSKSRSSDVEAAASRPAAVDTSATSTSDPPSASGKESVLDKVAGSVTETVAKAAKKVESKVEQAAKRAAEEAEVAKDRAVKKAAAAGQTAGQKASQKASEKRKEPGKPKGKGSSDSR